MKNNPFNKTLVANTGKDILKLFNQDKKTSSELISPPAGKTEIVIYSIWKTLLQHENFGISTDFFQVGGNSLKAVQLVTRICRHFLINVELTDIFLKPTISQLSSLIHERQSGSLFLPAILINPRPGRIPYSFRQERLWFIDRLEGSVQYHLPVVLRIKGEVNKEAIWMSMKGVVNRHEALRTVIHGLG